MLMAVVTIAQGTQVIRSHALGSLNKICRTLSVSHLDIRSRRFHSQLSISSQNSGELSFTIKTSLVHLLVGLQVQLDLS